MQVVLTQDVPGLGKAGDVRQVDADSSDYLLSKGYAAQTHIAEDNQEVSVRQLRSVTYVVSTDESATITCVRISPAEAVLLQKINQGLAPDLEQRYRALIKQRDAEALLPDEYEELLRLTDQVEHLEAQRVEYLIELARLRDTTVTALIGVFGIRPSLYV